MIHTGRINSRIASIMGGDHRVHQVTTLLTLNYLIGTQSFSLAQFDSLPDVQRMSLSDQQIKLWYFICHEFCLIHTGRINSRIASIMGGDHRVHQVTTLWHRSTESWHSELFTFVEALNRRDLCVKLAMHLQKCGIVLGLCNYFPWNRNGWQVEWKIAQMFVDDSELLWGEEGLTLLKKLE